MIGPVLKSTKKEEPKKATKPLPKGRVYYVGNAGSTTRKTKSRSPLFNVAILAQSLGRLLMLTALVAVQPTVFLHDSVSSNHLNMAESPCSSAVAMDDSTTPTTRIIQKYGVQGTTTPQDPKSVVLTSGANLMGVKPLRSNCPRTEQRRNRRRTMLILLLRDMTAQLSRGRW